MHPNFEGLIIMVDKSNLFENHLPKSDEIDTQQRYVGSIFRQTRESKGIKIEEVTRVTRIRPPFVEAIENEEWNLLPSPGFIPGFLKTYANYLGMDETEILARYHASRLADEERLIPLYKSGKNYKKNLLIWVLGALFIAIIGTVIVLDPLPWKERYEFFFKLIKPEIVKPQRLENHANSASVSNNEYGYGEEKLTAGEHDLANSSDTTFSEQKDTELKTESASVISFQNYVPDIQKELPLTKLNISESSDQQKPSEVASLKNQIPEKGYLLEVIVHTDVFLRVKIDDLPPKDYMLKADKTISWIAEEKFDLRIGNASSLTLILNGEEVKNVGAPGMVVNLRLPRI